MTTEHWQDGNAKCFGMLLDGRAQETGIKRRGSDATMLLVYNAHHDVVNFTFPAVTDGLSWLGLIDTNRPDARMAEFEFGHVYGVPGGPCWCSGLPTIISRRGACGRASARCWISLTHLYLAR